jgi:SAM-dependent methyltransferase
MTDRAPEARPGARPVTDDDTSWEANAQWWQDGFTDGADPEYEEQILPIVAEELGERTDVLDVGTGEGQLARHLLAHGVDRVTGIDPTVNQLRAAAARGGAVRYVRGGATALPFADGTFDGVLACLVFEHIAEIDDALAEVARVLAPDGTFLFLLNHPLLQAPDSGWVDDHILGEQYWRIGPYLVESLEDEELAPGVRLPFFHRPMSRYVNGMAANGLLVDRMLEPAPPPGFIARAVEYAGSAAFPRLLVLRARRN